MPTLSRRTIVVGGLSVIGASAIGGSVLLSQGGTSAPEEAEVATDNVELVRSRFAPHVGTAFTASAATGSFPLVLETIEDVLPVRAPGDEERFNLLFTSAGSEPPQGIYTLQHPDADPAVLFLSAVGPEGSARRLQALVDRSV